MRRGLTLTKKEQKQIERQLAALDARFAAGKMPKMLYNHERAKLISNLQRPKAATTPLEMNQKGFFQTRRNIEFGPAPIGYWDANVSNSQPRAMVNRNKIRSSLLSIHDNEWWNDGFQEAIRTAVNSNNTPNNGASFSQNEGQNGNSNETVPYIVETIMQANQLGATINANTFNSTETWLKIQNSQPVMNALQKLAESVENTVRRMVAAGMDEAYARDAIRQAAMAAGVAMTTQGYSAERAAEITAMVVRGELSEQGAVNQVTNDLQVANRAIVAVNQNNASNPMWRNDFNIHAMGPSGGGVSLQQLMEMKNELQEEFDLENDPVARNEITAALANLEKEIQQRKSGMQSVSNGMLTPPGMPSTNTQGKGYNPLSNLQANKSSMEITAAALQRGGPDLWNIVNDIVTIQGNMYFDYMSGGSASVDEYGQLSEITNNTNETTIYPVGEFTIYASGKASIPQLEIVLSGLANALMSPVIPDGEKGYLRYLQNRVRFQIDALKSQADVTVLPNNQTGQNNGLLPNNNAFNLINNINNIANNVYNMPNNGNQNTMPNTNTNNPVSAQEQAQANAQQNQNTMQNANTNNNAQQNQNTMQNANTNNSVSAQEQAQANAQQNQNATNAINQILQNTQQNQNQHTSMTVNDLLNWGVPGNLVEFLKSGHPPLSDKPIEELKLMIDLMNKLLADPNVPNELKEWIQDLLNALNAAYDNAIESLLNLQTTNTNANNGQSQTSPQVTVNPVSAIGPLFTSAPPPPPAGLPNFTSVPIDGRAKMVVMQNKRKLIQNGLPGLPSMKPITTTSPVFPNSAAKIKASTLRGSTSTTTSSRSHGGARFTEGNDPRAAHRTW